MNRNSRFESFGPSVAGSTKMGGHKRRMPLKDRISLGPLEKYTIYNRFPYKLMLHILLLIVMSVLVSSTVQSSQSQLRAQQFVWYKKFLLNTGDEDVPVMDDFNREKRLFSVNEVKDFVGVSMENYYNMRDASDDEFEDYKLNNNARLFVISMDSKN